MSLTEEKTAVMQFIEENDVKFIRLQLCDLLGRNRNIAITSSQMERALSEGVAIDASLIEGYKETKHTDLVLHPDVSTVQILPWRPQQGKVARIICDVRYLDGKDYPEDSRYILKQAIAKAEKKGYFFNLRAECEFYLFKQDENGDPTTIPSDSAGYFDHAPHDRGENTRREICLTLEDMGFEIESSRHEAGCGQHQIDFKSDGAISLADKIMIFKTVVKTVAQRNGLHASFMPKPIVDEPGSGMHVHVSLNKDGRDVFENNSESLTEEAQQFVAGVLSHVKGLTALANPLVNSYKRLTEGHEAPNHIGWSFGNSARLIRIPSAPGKHRRFELKSPDPTCNPYLVFAVLLSAGLDGIEKKLPLTEASQVGAQGDGSEQELPITLLDALVEMQADGLIQSVLGESLVEKYIKLKTAEWMEYIKTVHPWEIERYLLSY